MKNLLVISLPCPDPTPESRSVRDELVREGARWMLHEAVNAEVNDWTDIHGHFVDEDGRRVVVRNGYHGEREVLTGAGPLPVNQPRMRDKTNERKFTSKILPPFMRRVPSIDAPRNIGRCSREYTRVRA